MFHLKRYHDHLTELTISEFWQVFFFEGLGSVLIFYLDQMIISPKTHCTEFFIEL